MQSEWRATPAICHHLFPFIFYFLFILKKDKHQTRHKLVIIINTVTPKSGEVELHMAPRLAVASMASTAKAQLGI